MKLIFLDSNSLFHYPTLEQSTIYCPHAPYVGCLAFHKTEQPFNQFNIPAPKALKGGKMKKHKQAIAVITLFLGLGGLLFSSIKTVNTQSSNGMNNRDKSDKSDENFPLVSLDDASRQVENVDEKIRKRNEKFDKWDWIRKTVSAEATSANIINDWQIGLPALPIKKSDAVVIGTVNFAEAFLSNDKTGVYSEFSVLVSGLIKDNQSNPIESDSNIIVQRAGGRVIYPSGKILKYSISGQEMPRLNGKYIFFLRYDQQRQTYYIITAYEISNGKITALDGKGKAEGSGFKFSKYNGTDEQQFINELRNALYSKTDSTEEVKSPK